MKDVPILSNVINLLDVYPRISAWVVLSIGIVGLLVYEARDVGLSTGNWIALVVASIIVSGLCVWIVSWEDEDDAAGTVVVKSETDNPTASVDKTTDDNNTIADDN